MSNIPTDILIHEANLMMTGAYSIFEEREIGLSDIDEELEKRWQYEQSFQETTIT